MQGVFLAWESIMPAVVQNFFVKCGFSTKVPSVPTVTKKTANGWNCKTALIAVVLSKNCCMLTNVSQQPLICQKVWTTLAQSLSRRWRKSDPSLPDPLAKIH